MSYNFGIPYFGQIKKDYEIFDTFSRFELQPPNSYELYRIENSGNVDESGISQNNRLRLAVNGKNSWAGVVANGLGISRQVIFSEITDTRTKLDINMHLEFQGNTELEAFVGLHTGGHVIKQIPDSSKRYCGVKVNTDITENLMLGSSNTDKEKITILDEFVAYHYRLHILWKSNDVVKISLFRGTPEDDFKTLVGEHESDVFAEERIDTFFLHWFIKTKSNQQRGLISKGWWIKAL